jgi:AcrR family transcriptional regulator
MRPTPPPDRRSELLEAARAIFARKGWESTTIAEIVSRAGVAQGTFYLYFPGKEALAGAFAEAMGERLAQLAEERTARCRSFETALARLFESAYAVAEEHRDVYPVASRGLELAGDTDEWMSRTAASRGWLEGFVAHWQRQGAIDMRVRPPVTARVLRDALDRATRAFILFGDRNYGRELAEVLRRGLAAA